MDQTPRSYEPLEVGGSDEPTTNILGATRIVKPDESKAAPTIAEANKNAVFKTKTRRLVVCIDGTSNQFSDKVVVALRTSIHHSCLVYGSWVWTEYKRCRAL